MVHCIVFGCASKSGKQCVTFASIPKIVTNQGVEHEELTRERRRLWTSAISRDDIHSKRVLESEEFAVSTSYQESLLLSGIATILTGFPL